MRIISGTKKSILIRAPKDLPSRPTTDKVKESLFNILSNKFKLDELKVLDLFAGTGNISYEFSSRGCKKIFSVDNNFKCIKFIRDTALKHGFGIVTRKNNSKDFLLNTNENFDIIFLDPPYNFSMDQYLDLINVIKQRNLLFENGEIIIEHSSNISLIEKNNKIDERKYGSSILSFIKKASL